MKFKREVPPPSRIPIGRGVAGAGPTPFRRQADWLREGSPPQARRRDRRAPGGRRGGHGAPPPRFPPGPPVRRSRALAPRSPDGLRTAGTAPPQAGHEEPQVPSEEAGRPRPRVGSRQSGESRAWPWCRPRDPPAPPLPPEVPPRAPLTSSLPGDPCSPHGPAGVRARADSGPARSDRRSGWGDADAVCRPLSLLLSEAPGVRLTSSPETSPVRDGAGPDLWAWEVGSSPARAAGTSPVRDRRRPAGTWPLGQGRSRGRPQGGGRSEILEQPDRTCWDGDNLAGQTNGSIINSTPLK